MGKALRSNKRALAILDAFALGLPARFVWRKELRRNYERLVRTLESTS
jgi:hypothetical protein